MPNTNNRKYSTEIVKYSTQFVEKERKRAFALIFFFNPKLFQPHKLWKKICSEVTLLEFRSVYTIKHQCF